MKLLHLSPLKGAMVKPLDIISIGVMVNPKLLSPNSEFWDQNLGTFRISEFQKERGRLAK